MLVECATTSTNNVSISISAASSSHNCTVTNTFGAAATTFSTGVTTSTTTIPTSSITALGNSNPGSATASIVVSVSTPDGLSSGSNSCSNSIGHSISTTSNSISNSNSIGNSWRVGSDHFNGRRGSAEKSLGNSSGDFNLSHSRGDAAEFSHSRNIEYCSGATNKIPNDAPANFVKYGSPLSEYKYGKELNKSGLGEQAPAKNMVDVEACLASTPPHLLIRSLSSLSHHSTQLSTLPRSPEREEVVVFYTTNFINEMIKLPLCYFSVFVKWNMYLEFKLIQSHPSCKSLLQYNLLTRVYIVSYKCNFFVAQFKTSKKIHTTDYLTSGRFLLDIKAPIATSFFCGRNLLVKIK